ncbi:hypothetical protein F4604DRAFT_1677228 [Suillus subluteus]|nr:hypothetical protein F4604DRAFT_1677228 [Suillus subluteus]
MGLVEEFGIQTRLQYPHRQSKVLHALELASRRWGILQLQIFSSLTISPHFISFPTIQVATSLLTGYTIRSPEGFFTGVSGLSLLSAIHVPNPLIFMEPKVVYRSAESDLTLLTWGTPGYHCESTLRFLNSPPPSLAPFTHSSLRSAKVELIDLRMIFSWDIETVVKSMRRTKRFVIVHQAGMVGGVGGEIAAEVGKRAFLRLEALVKRITGWN